MTLLTACLWGPKAPERDFSLEELLIEVSDLPQGWWLEAAPAAPLQVDGEIIAKDSIVVAFLISEVPREVIVQKIYRFRYTNTAAKEYRKQLGIHFNDPTLTLPEGLPYQSELAESASFACRTMGEEEGCFFMGVYEEFLVVLNVFTRGSIEYSDLENILQTMEQKMVTYLE